MKKFISVLIAFVTFISFASLNVFAATYFQYKNFIFESYSDKTCKIIDYVGSEEDVVVPDELIGDDVVSLAFGAFMDKTDIKTVTLPNTLTTMENAVFTRSYNLASVNIPANCTTIGSSIFQDCISLRNVVIESNLTVITRQMFLNCASLEEITLPATVETIDRFAFRGCISLKSITIPKSTTNIASNAFMDCPNLTIRGYVGSYAQQFATDYNIPFEPINDYMLGDVDLDGEITIYDVTTLQKYLADITTLTSEQLSVCDVNKDGSIGIDDATTIQKYLADVILSFD
ncbi:MAG: leucine-rich repeat protein [Ruminococcus sp.]|nr:leucine-rich repeat protein [Ruminococcus sp.]